MSPEELSDAIIEFEVKSSVNDTALAFSSYLPVERSHTTKTGEAKYTTEEAEQVLDYIQANSRFKITGSKKKSRVLKTNFQNLILLSYIFVS